MYLWLLVFFCAFAPLAAHATGSGVSALGEHMKSAALATRHEVTAITLEAAPAASDTPYGQVTQFWVDAWWRAPHGQRRTGQILVQDSTPTGAAVKIWITDDGTVAAPPLSQPQIRLLTLLASACAVIVLAVALAATWAVARRALDRHRMAAWEADWDAAGPRWNRQSW